MGYIIQVYKNVNEKIFSLIITIIFLSKTCKMFKIK